MKARYLAPLILFLALIALFVAGLQRNLREIPSPLVGRPAPAFVLPKLTSPGEISGENFKRHPVSLLNVWASWCTACRQEHPFLMELARRGAVPVYGLNYKDDRTDAIQWLAQDGNPYVASAFDKDGLVGIDWGVYGVPETFVVDGEGTIRYKHVGPLGPQTWRTKIAPIIEQLKSRHR